MCVGIHIDLCRTLLCPVAEDNDFAAPVGADADAPAAVDLRTDGDDLLIF